MWFMLLYRNFNVASEGQGKRITSIRCLREYAFIQEMPAAEHRFVEYEC